MEQYTCPTGGDESFEAQVEALEGGLVSLSYTAMWSCSTMPSPDSTEGALNLALPSVTPLGLKSQFSDKEQYQNFSKQVQTLYTEQMEQAGKSEDCSFAHWAYFTIESTTLVLHFDKASHSPSNCEAEVRLSRSELQGQISPDSPLLP